MPKSFSYSKIGQFENCPRQYKFNHIEKAVVEKPVGVEMFLGSTIHRTLERLYKFKVNGRIQPEEEMLAGYHEMWEGPDRDNIKVTREFMAIDDLIKIGDDSLRKYYKMYYPFDEGEILGLENNVHFPLDAANRFMIHAKLDKLVKREDGVVEIVDYKTQAKLPTQQSLDNNLQMGLYQMGVNFLWPQFEKIELKQIYLRHSVAMSTTMGPELIDELRQKSMEKIMEIEQAVREDNFPVKESGLCDYCVYYNLCPAKRHRLALEDNTEEVFDPQMGQNLADRYLKLSREKKIIEAELSALKDDILKYCKETDLTRLDSGGGNIKITTTESQGFPTKTENERAFVQISRIVRDAGLDECFKLEPNVLYKEFYTKEKLEAGLMEKLRGFLRTRLTSTIRPSYNSKE